MIVALEQAELYNLDIENILSNAFLSFLLMRYFLKDFHSFSSKTAAILNDGIVRPIMWFADKDEI
jgi:hypothetical protein